MRYENQCCIKVDKVRAELGDLQGQEEKGVVVVSAPQYCRCHCLTFIAKYQLCIYAVHLSVFNVAMNFVGRIRCPLTSLIFLKRFRAVLKRLDGVEKRWMRNSLVMALGGFATKTRCG